MANKEQSKNTGRTLPRIQKEKCSGCGECAKVCYRKAVSFAEDDKAMIFSGRCTGIENCGRCLDVCDNEAIKAG